MGTSKRPAERWLTTPEVAAWRAERTGRPTTVDTIRPWLRRHYRGEVRQGEAQPGKVAPNLYALSALEAAAGAMIGQGGPGKPRPKRAADDPAQDGGTQ